MNVKGAVVYRIQAICAKQELTVNALANYCGIAPTTLYSMFHARSQNIGIVSIQKICDGLGITVREFFNDPLFDHLDSVIQ